jgi:ribose transport system substrate-binding protein
MRMRRWAIAMTVASLAATACGGDTSSDDTAAPDEPVAADPADDELLRETRGPGGEEPTPSTEITLTDDQIAEIRDGGYTAALLWHTTSDFTNAVTAGATDAFAEFGIEVVATTDAGFDSAKQQSDVETVLARNPDVMISLPLDPVSAAEAFRPAVEAGTELVFLSNVPDGYTHGEDYASIVTDDLYAMGALAADELAEALDGSGQVGWIFHDAAYYVTNQRDNAFKTVIEQDHPDIEIVAEQGLADPARAEEIANAMITQNPDLNGIYVTWAEPAEGVVSALRAAGRDDVKVVTLDLSETLALDMVQDGNVVAMVADEAYELGHAMARVAALALLGESTPAFVVAPAIAVTTQNLVDGWQTSLNREPPASVTDALGQ